MKNLVKHYRTTISPVDTGEIRINGIGIQERMPTSIIDRPKGMGDYLAMFFHDEMVIGADDGIQPRHRRQLVIWAPGQAQYYGNNEVRWVHSWIHLQGSHMGQCLRKTGLPTNHLIGCSPQEIDPYLEQIYAELVAMPYADATIMKNLIENWLRNLARKCLKKSVEPPIPEKFQQLRQEMDMEFSARHTIKSLAQRVHLSPSHFCCLFQKYFGQAPIDYLIEQRMNHALYLLHNRNLTISEIAQATGYNDVYCFSKQFKKRLGVSPRAMREKI